MSTDNADDKPGIPKENKQEEQSLIEEKPNVVENEPKEESSNLRKEKESNKEKEVKGDQKDSATWTAVWDENYKAYYWWNTATNETTWTDPNAPDLDQEAKEETKAQERIKDYSKANQAINGQQPYFPSPDYSHLYTSQAHFNSRTGRFTTQEDASRLNPESMSIENRATRQMQFYFDVDAYTEQRNKQKLMDQGIKRKLTRKEVEYFKKMKQEKKNKRAREWLLQ
ncbi:hypothetical protein BY458DRAFT_517401 [Sporodiniella umbellata]|nr:hypothetical protein BY458DRAFT_517401 [Sporodiniella umbellata]